MRKNSNGSLHNGYQNTVRARVHTDTTMSQDHMIEITFDIRPTVNKLDPEIRLNVPTIGIYA